MCTFELPVSRLPQEWHFDLHTKHPLFANHPNSTLLDPIYVPVQEIPPALVHQPIAAADLETMKLIRSQFYTYLPRLLPVLAREGEVQGEIQYLRKRWSKSGTQTQNVNKPHAPGALRKQRSRGPRAAAREEEERGTSNADAWRRGHRTHQDHLRA